ncbi:sister chromatid cohesion protein Eso1 [Coniochaeta ligniaria NRRL 30616]|uniref:DNA polymerase eta n=1 Tax=Coniochaeta ligniaria NRRL 30616 TaxID=1408157 RepID=A0A1J7IT42_9PEZI|nr:sister chromatid cohesion protein Eso1 [Coniochaeta ligniaria NRRL 30616]
MSSSQGFRESSPAGAPGRRRSQFTYRHLSQLASYSTTNPLRVIAHIDLDAFYAQCEMVRLGVAEDQPLAVQQWQGLIAVNYPARATGIGRHCTVTDAKKLCPNLIAQHVATWREGDDKWAYHPDAAANIATHKVSLDPYRLESRKILAVIKESLPPNLQKVEKASIDEVFLDLSAHVHSLLLERFEELARPPPYDDPTEQLPMPSISALDWKADALVDLDDEDAEIDDPDWDDVAILIGSEIVRYVRAAVKEKLKYTCSAGIANSKMVSKLGSAYKKPNQQTVIRNRARQQFLSGFKFTKIRNLGGKLGEQVVQLFNTDSVQDLLVIPVEQLKSKLGDDTGVWVHNIIRGVDTSEVNSRTQIKSMLSAKSFKPTINTFEQGVKWLRIFAADIFSRLVEEGVLENRRRPKTINLHHRHGAQTRSRQGPIPQGRSLDESTLFELARGLLSQIVLEGKVWPCANLSLSVGGFEDGITGNMGIGSFLVKGEEAQALKANSSGAPQSRSDLRAQPTKRRRVDYGGIQRFFSQKQQPSRDGEYGLGSDDTSPTHEGETASEKPLSDDAASENNAAYMCLRCKTTFEDAEQEQNHNDWHLAKDLQEEEERRGSSRFAHPSPASASTSGNMSRKGAAAHRRAGRPKKTDSKQSKLSFG